MNPRSLRLRLLGGAALWIVLALLAAGIAIGWMFVGNVERSVREGLSASLNRLVAQIDPALPELLPPEPLPDPRYEIPQSGVYWQVEDMAGNSWRSLSLFDHVLATGGVVGSDGKESFARLPGPGGQSLSAMLREVKFGEAGRYRITLAEDRAVLDESINQFGGDLMLALAALGVALIVAAWLQVRVGLSPLANLRRGIGAVRRGEEQKLPASYPSEVLPLVGEVNELLDQQQKSMDFARARAADLAHGLKTPLSVLRNLAGHLREQGDGKAAEEVDEIVGEMDDRVEYQLRLSRLRMRTKAHQLSASLNEAVERTLTVLTRTHEGEQIEWDVSLQPGLTVDLDRHDLLELVGVILENAAKWGKSRVEVKAQADSEFVELRISDDGPGLSDAQIAQLGVRGQRLDESRRGSGFGVAIALEVVKLNSGTMTFGRATIGGLEVTVRLPRS